MNTPLARKVQAMVPLGLILDSVKSGKWLQLQDVCSVIVALKSKVNILRLRIVNLSSPTIQNFAS